MLFRFTFDTVEILDPWHSIDEYYIVRWDTASLAAGLDIRFYLIVKVVIVLARWNVIWAGSLPVRCPMTLLT